MELIEIGIIVKPQGLKGELKIFPQSSQPEKLLKIKKVTIEGETKERTVLNSRIREGLVYFYIDGVEHIDDAEKLRNKKIYIERDFFPLESENEFFIDDLIGLAVHDENDFVLGKLEDVEQFGSADILCIRGEGRIWRIPYLDEIVIDVSPENGKITLNKEKYIEIRMCN